MAQLEQIDSFSGASEQSPRGVLACSIGLIGGLLLWAGILFPPLKTGFAGTGVVLVILGLVGLRFTKWRRMASAAITVAGLVALGFVLSYALNVGLIQGFDDAGFWLALVGALGSTLQIFLIPHPREALTEFLGEVFSLVMNVIEWVVDPVQRVLGVQRMGYLFVLPNMLIFGIFVLFPMLLNFYYSLTGGTALFPQDREFVGMANFENLFDCQNFFNPNSCAQDLFWRGIFNTITFVVFQVGGMVLIALITALALNGKIRARGFFRSVFFYPVLLSPVVVALIWKWILQREGLLNALLGAIGGAGVVVILTFAAFVFVAWLVNARLPDRGRLGNALQATGLAFVALLVFWLVVLFVPDAIFQGAVLAVILALAGWELYQLWEDNRGAPTLFWRVLPLLLLALWVLLLALGGAVLAALALLALHYFHHWRRQTLEQLRLGLPLLLGVVALVIFWLKGGLLGQMLILGEKNLSFLVQPPGEWATMWVILVSIWAQMGFYTLILLAGLQSIPAELYEAGAIDGANKWQTFRGITLPLLMPTMFVVLVLSLIRAVQVFDQVFVLTGGGPGTATQYIVQYIYDTGFSNQIQLFGLASAASVVLGVVLLVLTLFQLRLGQTSELATG